MASDDLVAAMLVRIPKLINTAATFLALPAARRDGKAPPKFGLMMVVRGSEPPLNDSFQIEHVCFLIR
jgi:hypothetical protein